jgi:hypothetical protein
MIHFLCLIYVSCVSSFTRVLLFWFLLITQKNRFIVMAEQSKQELIQQFGDTALAATPGAAGGGRYGRVCYVAAEPGR